MKLNIKIAIKTVFMLSILLLGDRLYASDTLNVKMNVVGWRCSRLNINFYDISYTNGKIASHTWDFDDGEFATIPNPVHKFSKPGTYKVKLRISLQSGFSDSTEITLKIRETPVPVFTYSKACENVPTTFVNLSDPKNIGATHWLFQDSGFIFTFYKSTFVKTFKSPGIYKVKLVMEDTGGCRDTATQNVNILKLVKANFKFSPSKPCIKDTIRFTALPQTKYTDSLSYLWNVESSAQFKDSLFDYRFASNTTKSYIINYKISIKGGCSDSMDKIINFNEKIVPTYIFIDTISKAGKKYFKTWPSYSGVNPEPEEWGVKYNWIIYRSKTDSVVYNNQQNVEIPDTFTVTNGLRIKLTTIHNSGCKWVDEVFNFSGIGTLVGNVYDDLDTNKYFTTGDTFVKNVMVKCAGIKRNYYAITNEKGEFRFNIFDKDTIRFTANRIDRFAKFYSQSANVSIIYYPGVVYGKIGIPMRSKKYKDLELFLYSNAGTGIIKGTEQTMFLELRNNSPMNVNTGDIVLKFDAALSRLKSLDKFSITAGNPTTAKFSGFNVPALGKRLIEFTLYVNPDSNNLKDIRKIEAFLSNNSDSSAANDTSVLKAIVRTAYDPNIKESRPNGIIGHSVNRIKYTIMFQNEGTADARNVVLRDTIDARFELSSVYLTEAVNNNYKVSVDNGNTLVFKFENINLPPKNEFPEKSKGFISFYINLAKPFENGDSVRNRAGIYFDYEKVVLTPWASLVRNDKAYAAMDFQENKGIRIYPVPVKQSITLDFENRTNRQIEIYNSAGILVKYAQSIGISTNIETAELPDGLYFIKTSAGETGRFIKLQD